VLYISACSKHFVREEEPISELSWVARTESTLKLDEYDIVWKSTDTLETTTGERQHEKQLTARHWF
jgi:hypothetical protein